MEGGVRNTAGGTVVGIPATINTSDVVLKRPYPIQSACIRELKLAATLDLRRFVYAAIRPHTTEVELIIFRPFIYDVGHRPDTNLSAPVRWMAGILQIIV